MNEHVKPPFGLPYAQAGIDEQGYHVVCPICGQKFYGEPGDEDGVTKSAILAYGEHFEEESAK